MPAQLAALVLAVVNPELEGLRTADLGEVRRVLKVGEGEQALLSACLANARESGIAADVEPRERIRAHPRQAYLRGQILVEIVALDMVSVAEESAGRRHEEGWREQLGVRQQNVLLSLRQTLGIGVGHAVVW